MNHVQNTTMNTSDVQVTAVVARVRMPRTYSTQNDRPRSRIDAQSRSGESQPVTEAAKTLPADPSRAET
jgi:hypothetical protein